MLAHSSLLASIYSVLAACRGSEPHSVVGEGTVGQDLKLLFPLGSMPGHKAQ